MKFTFNFPEARILDAHGNQVGTGTKFDFDLSRKEILSIAYRMILMAFGMQNKQMRVDQVVNRLDYIQ